MTGNAHDLREFAQAEDRTRQRSASAWRGFDLVLVVTAAALAATGGVAGVAKATVPASASVIGQTVSDINPVIAGVLAVAASIMSALTIALGASKKARDDLAASAEYQQLATSAGDFLLDADEWDLRKLEVEFSKLRAKRDKVFERFAKLPAPTRNYWLNILAHLWTATTMRSLRGGLVSGPLVWLLVGLVLWGLIFQTEERWRSIAAESLWLGGFLVYAYAVAADPTPRLTMASKLSTLAFVLVGLYGASLMVYWILRNNGYIDQSGPLYLIPILTLGLVGLVARIIATRRLDNGDDPS